MKSLEFGQHRWSRRRLMLQSRWALASAFLPCFVTRSGAAAPFVAPRNVIFVFHPGGLESGWKPGTDASGLVLSGALQALAPFREKLLVVHGLVSGIRNEIMAHVEGMTSLWTGSQIASKDDYSAHPSVDQLIADSVAGSRPIRSLEVGVQSQAGFGAGSNSTVMIYSASGKLPPEDDPQVVFRRIFGGATTPDERRRQLADDQSILDIVRSDLESLRPRLATEAQQKLAEHLEGVRALERRLVAFESNRCEVGAMPAQLSTHDQQNFSAISELQMDMVTLALKCQVTRVASVQLSNSVSDRKYPNVNPSMTAHSVHHSGTKAQKLALNQFYVAQVARLLKKLDDVKVASGETLLDQTLVVWGSEMAIGNHLKDPIPFFIAGGGRNGFFHHNRLVQVGDRSRTTRLLLSVMHAFGLNDAQFLGDLVDETSRGPLAALSRVIP
jgi:Protein of unknown function (DUF1552)